MKTSQTEVERPGSLGARLAYERKLSALLAVLCLGLAALTPTGLQGASEDTAKSVPRGGRVGWGRMITPVSTWSIHSEEDGKLADFIRTQTTLNIESTWYSADPGSLDQLCTYPFIYVKNLMQIRKTSELANVAEYLKRGGFLCVDACGAQQITHDMPGYFRGNRDLFMKLIPGAEIRHLPEDHAIYRCYFDVGEKDIFTPDTGEHPHIGYYGIYGVYSGDRLIAVISMDGLECGWWTKNPLRMPGCMKMLTNIYVYAMTRATESAPTKSP